MALITSDFKCKGKLFFLPVLSVLLHRGVGACGKEKKIHFKMLQCMFKDGETTADYKGVNEHNLEYEAMGPKQWTYSF